MCAITLETRLAVLGWAFSMAPPTMSRLDMAVLFFWKPWFALGDYKSFFSMSLLEHSLYVAGRGGTLVGSARGDAKAKWGSAEGWGGEFTLEELKRSDRGVGPTDVSLWVSTPNSEKLWETPSQLGPLLSIFARCGWWKERCRG